MRKWETLGSDRATPGASSIAVRTLRADAGVPAAAIAERLGLPLETVRRRRRALAPVRARGRPYAAEGEAALRDALAGGRSLHELAPELGRTEGALRARARSLGLLPKGSRRRWTRREDEILREGYERGLTRAAVANVDDLPAFPMPTEHPQTAIARLEEEAA